MCGRYELTTDLEQLPRPGEAKIIDGIKNHYEKQPLIKPNDPVLVLKQEHARAEFSIMLWGLLADWEQESNQ
ncbi:SOS response-associated peptidase family protein [Prochlorococcus sp. MIT 1307]|uniref:SOS response-associated peptidase family protein n=1 Tax=Prochlorococcus sp. MIT 1307 TaxID=3096219 RepID=UPI002A76389F|nr:SOS response-associated peptidase family protein [Prochlorococcus sp. MIT 1307]